MKYVESNRPIIESTYAGRDSLHRRLIRTYPLNCRSNAFKAHSRTIVFLICVATILGCQTPNVPIPIPVVGVTNEKLTSEEAKTELQRIWSRQQHVSRLAYELGINNVELCGEDTKRDIGIEWITLADFPNVNLRIAGSQLGVGRLPFVTTVTPGSPAERAGIRHGDMLLRVDGKEIPEAPQTYWTEIEINNVKVPRFRWQIDRMLDNAAKSVQTMKISVLRDRNELDLELELRDTCDLRVVVVEDSDLRLENAGMTVLVSNALLDLTHSDIEAQMVIAHQFAHILSKHDSREKRNQAIGGAVGGVAATALLLPVAIVGALAGENVDGVGEIVGASAEASSKLGGNVGSLQREREADYLALYLLKRIGIDINDVSPFWRRLPDDSGFRNTHAHIDNRSAIIEATVKEIHSKEDAGVLLLPNQESESTE